MAFGLTVPDITGPQDSGFGLSPELLAQVRQMMATAPETGATTASVQGGPAPLSLAAAPAQQPSGGSIQDRFVGTLRDGGLTNPNGLGAVAAYAQHESRYSPSNITGSWSDPSESGQAGTSGGILSWRGPRLDAMRAYTQGAPDPVVAQAKFLLQENPKLTQSLQNAKSPQEANDLMAQAWKFAGYNRPGGEYASRLSTTQNFATRFANGQTMQMPGGSNAPAAFSLGGVTQAGGSGTSLPFGGGMAATPDAASSPAAPASPDAAGTPGQAAGAGKGGQGGQKQGASPMQFRTVRPRPFGFFSPMQFAGQTPTRQG
jgi:hypothetical protein